MNIPERVDGMGNLTDGELVARVRQGNQEAFSELISRYYGLLQWKISGYRKLGIDADDLLQEATLGLLDSVMSFQAVSYTHLMLPVERRVGKTEDHTTSGFIRIRIIAFLISLGASASCLPMGAVMNERLSLRLL